MRQLRSTGNCFPLLSHFLGQLPSSSSQLQANFHKREGRMTLEEIASFPASHLEALVLIMFFKKNPSILNEIKKHIND